MTGGDASRGGTAFGEGSGVDNEGGTVLITNSTIENNALETASFGNATGGGLANDEGTMTITDSTVSGNVVTGTGGGGIANLGGTMTITGSTISGNTVSGDGGGIYNNGGSVVMTSSTIANNTSHSGASSGAGIFSQGGSAVVGDTIVATNHTGSITGNCGGTISSDGFNLTDDATAAACSFTGTGDLVNVGPALGPLANNGGPTATQLPAPNSPAVGAVPEPTTVNGTTVCGPGAFDQQGSPRPQAGSHACTIGAVEGPLAAQTVMFTSSAANPVVGGTYTPSANASSGAAVIFSIDPATSPANVCTIGPTTPKVTFTHVGTCQVDATAPAQGGFASATASHSVVVQQGASAVGLASTPSAPAFGQPVSFNAVVNSPGAAAGAPVPTGTVNFTLDGTAIGTAVTVNASGDATSAPVPGLAPGTHTVVATYSGDTNFTGEKSGPVTVTIGCPSTVNGNSGPITVSGSTCVQGGTVSGAINVGPGASIALANVTINGQVKVQGSGTVTICGSTLADPVSISGTTGAVTLGYPGFSCASDQLSGPLTVSNSAGPVTIAGTHFTGTVNIKGTTGAVNLSGATINGPLQLGTNSGPLTLTGTAIEGPLTVSGNHNGPVVISGNTVAGAVSVNANTASVAPVVSANTLNASLGCTANLPPPVDGGAPNIVSGKATAQCAGLV